MTEINNILIIGKTGSGKSTLANVITITNKFEEGSGILSKTKEVQVEKTEIEISDGKKKTYRVIDTVGIGDTEMPTWEVLYELAKVSSSVKNGVSQILLVVKENAFTDDVKETYKLLEKFFFDKDIAKYTTIVRTHFPGFRNEDKCKQEKLEMLENNGEFGEFIKEFSGVICVDDPSIEDEDSRAQSENRRKHSRDKLISHLKNIFQDTENNEYRPANLDKLNEVINPYIAKESEVKGENNKSELGKVKRKIVKKTLQHITKIDPNFSQKEEIQKQLESNKEARVIQILPFNWKWWK